MISDWPFLRDSVTTFAKNSFIIWTGKGFNAAFSVSQKPEKLIVPVFHQSFPLHFNQLTGVFWQTFKGAET